MTYLHVFNTEQEFINSYGIGNPNYIEPWTSYTKETSAITYNAIIELIAPEK